MSQNYKNFKNCFPELCFSKVQINFENVKSRVISNENRCLAEKLIQNI